MVAGFLVAVAFTALCYAAYSVLQTSIKWAQEIGRSIQIEKEKRLKFQARCATCGIDFLNNSQIEDGICTDCQRPVCSKCSARVWRCPYCNKKRYENEFQRRKLDERKTSLTTIFHNFMIAKDDNSSTDSLSKWSQDESVLTGTSGYNTTSFISVKSKFPDFGSDISNGWSSDYESDTGRSTAAESWEDNWLFKKKLHSTEHMQPLAMFVPKPNKLSKARIGGIDVDDLSDLSEYSDSEIDEILK